MAFKIKHGFYDLIKRLALVPVTAYPELAISGIAMPAVRDIVRMKITLLNKTNIISNAHLNALDYSGVMDVMRQFGNLIDDISSSEQIHFFHAISSFYELREIASVIGRNRVAEYMKTVVPE